MGQKNAVTKRFCSDKIRFADLINGIYFQGREIIHPKDLTESSEVYAEPLENDSGGKNRDYLERTRDIKMRHQSEYWLLKTNITWITVCPFATCSMMYWNTNSSWKRSNIVMKQRALLHLPMNVYAR